MAEDASSSAPDPGSGPASGQVSGSMASVLVRVVRASLGEQGVDELLRMAKVDRTAAYLEDVGNWIWYEEATALFEAAAQLTGDEDIARRVGEESIRQHAGTPVATLLRSLGSPEAVFEQMTSAVTKFSTVTAMEPVEVEPGRAVVRATPRPGYHRHPRLCDWSRGLLSAPPALFGLPSGAVEESRCEARGDDECLYTITWDAADAAEAADPHKLVTALEVQLAAMADRLESMYATARDLIAVDDVDAALVRMTERAGTAVRAPKYLLAVRTRADGELHVHHRGFDDEDPLEAARALLEDAEAGDGRRLVAEVASASRSYGRLMAASPAGGFFSYERDLLDVYARYAAAVLETATALDDARTRHEQASALLTLSRSVAVASSSAEVAQRLADAVPAVVDCDRVVAFLWSDNEEALRYAATTATSDQTGLTDLVRELRIRPADTRHLARLLDSPDPQPLFFDTTTDDEFILRTIRETGSVALIVVPIVANGRFYGILNASVVERPERLDPSPALLDRLAGVVAQASIALENARLIETMAHQARHDNLTGLLAHRAFHEALEDLLRDRAQTEPFTLAAIDIDDFKLVNDVHGHPVGDKALRRVADALTRSTRDEDTVFRVGGEEFAVLMPGLTASEAVPVAERLRTAVAHTPFTVPLRVSIGVASWPADAADAESLIEHADAALYAAKRAGKDRTSVAADAASGSAGIGDAGARPALLDALRRRDAGSVAHGARVAALAVDVARALDLDDERLADLRTAGRLHDAGLVAVPDSILGKPAPLSEAEHAVVRTHPTVGAELLRAAGLATAARFVVEHHERFDGAGYPAGLAGEEIVLEARILHAAEAFCAMTSERPYRSAMTRAGALQELRRLSGAQFDPAVVRALDAALAAPAAEVTPLRAVDAAGEDDAQRRVA